MRIATSLTWAAFVTLVSASTCTAAIITVGDVVEGNSFGQRWESRDAGPFDHVQARANGPGIFKTHSTTALGDGINDFSDNSWSSLFNDGKTLAAQGGSVSSLFFDIVFDNTWGDEEEFDFDFQAYHGDNRVENVTIRKLKFGGGWEVHEGKWDCSKPQLNAVPEPSSLIVWSLIGLSFVGGAYRRRRNAA
jgi:hypothetical protein